MNPQDRVEGKNILSLPHDQAAQGTELRKIHGMRSTRIATHVYPPLTPFNSSRDSCETDEEPCLKPRPPEDIKANVRILTTPVSAERREGQPTTMWAVVERGLADTTASR